MSIRPLYFFLLCIIFNIAFNSVALPASGIGPFEIVNKDSTACLRIQFAAQLRADLYTSDGAEDRLTMEARRVRLSFNGFLGVISLSGIVINNGIVLLDRIKIEMEEFQRSESEAILAASKQRFRPILLTTATTSLGLIPLWLGGGEMWQPMAIGIIFGLLFATVITLLFVPVLYKLLFRVSLHS